VLSPSPRNLSAARSRGRWISFPLVLSITLSSCAGFAFSATRAEAAAPATYRTISTANFIVQSTSDTAAAHALGAQCETLLAELKGKWFAASDPQTEPRGGEQADSTWTPKCVVVIHDTPASYLHWVPGGERTVGSSWIESSQGKIVARRIDIRGDKPNWFEGALPHELIHVLLADRFGAKPPGRWAEEGWAILVDPTEKQFRHDADLRRALARGEHFRLGEMLELTEYPGAERITAFYGQSASLVRFLAERRTPAEFSAFLKRAASHGYDAALREHYDIDGVADLERRWLGDLESRDIAAVPLHLPLGAP